MRDKSAYNKMIKKRKNSLAIKILKGLGYSGLVFIAATGPFLGLNMVKNIKRQNDKKEWRKFYESLRYLDRRGYVKILDRSIKGIKVKVTIKGEEVIKELDIDSMELKKQNKWDGKWRLIIFDVPNTKNKNRLTFSEKLKNLGLIMVQKSVWAYPYECYEEMMILRRFYDIERYVTYLKVSHVEDELNWREKFNLKNS